MKVKVEFQEKSDGLVGYLIDDRPHSSKYRKICFVHRDCPLPKLVNNTRGQGNIFECECEFEGEDIFEHELMGKTKNKNKVYFVKPLINITHIENIERQILRDKRFKFQISDVPYPNQSQLIVESGIVKLYSEEKSVLEEISKIFQKENFNVQIKEK